MFRSSARSKGSPAMKKDMNNRSNKTPDGEIDDCLISAPAKDDELIERKHQQIAEGASRLFFEKGFHRATIREIALSCGMSMGQLYHYISSKDDVLFLVYKLMQRQWLNQLRNLGIDRLEDPLERLEQALHATLEYMVERKELFLFVYTETKYLESSHLKAVLRMDDRNVVGFWRRLIEDVGLDVDKVGGVDFLANLISFLMVFLVMRGWNLKESTGAENIEALIAFIMRGLGLSERATEERLKKRGI